MSEFDKEAEREKLREKYGDEPADREATERMSDLLLKGATMTNRHCSECGDPIFRYDGQAFCPTCQEPVGTADTEPGATASPEAGAEPAGTDGDEAPDETAAGTAAAPGSGGAPTAGGAEPAAEHGGAHGDESASGGELPPGDEPAAGGTGTDATRQRRSPTAADAPPSPSDLGDDGDLAAAEASLARQVTALATAAERTDDLQRQEALLAAAGQAAEALAAVRRV